MRLFRRVKRIPPKYNHFPLSENMAQTVNDTKTTLVAIKAVIIMLGSTKITCSSSGPIPTPVNEANPRRYPTRLVIPLPLSSGVDINRKKHTRAPIAERKPACKMLVNKCTEAPTPAAKVDIARQAYTFLRCCLTGGSLKQTKNNY